MSATAKLMAMLGMDASQFTKGVDQAERRTKGFGSMLDGMKGRIAAAFTVGSAVAVGKSVMDMASQIVDAAETLGVTTDQFQALSLTARQFGVDAEGVAGVMTKIVKAQSDAASANPTKTITDAFETLGVTIDDLDSKNPAEIFELIAKSASKGASEMSAAFDVLGARGGPKFRALMKTIGETGLEGMVKAAKESGQIIAEAELGAMDKFMDVTVQDTINKAKKLVGGLLGGTLTAAGAGATVAKPVDTALENRLAREKRDTQDAAKIAQDAAEIRAKNAYDAMTNEQKILALKQEQADIDAKMAQAKTQTARAELDKQRAESEGKLASLEEGNVRPGAGMAYDQLRRIGAGVFGGTAADAVPKKQLDTLTRISATLTRIESKDATKGVF